MSDFLETKNNSKTGELNDWEKVITFFLILLFVLFKIFILPKNGIILNKSNIKKEKTIEQKPQKNNEYVVKPENTSSPTCTKKISQDKSENNIKKDNNEEDLDTVNSLNRTYQVGVNEEDLKSTMPETKNSSNQ